MKPELQKALFDKYPDLFRKALEEKVRPLWPIQLGIECGDGWYNIIDEICEKLTYLSKLEGNSPIIFQIKEKFGTMCFYTNGATSVQNDVVHFNSYRSAGTCEECGDPTGKRRTGRWIRTLCAKHAQEMGYQLEKWEDGYVQLAEEKDED